MKIETRTIGIKNIQTRIEFIRFEESDREELRKLYNYWHILNEGMKSFLSRGVNLPEGISETAFCLCFGNDFGRVLKVDQGSASFDVINLNNGTRIQIKAVSVSEDLTSFGPTSVWDEVYFLDFYCKGSFDGSFDVYKIEDDWIYNHMVNKKQTFREQQKEGRRPRFSIKKDIIKPRKLEPLKTCII